VDRALLATVHGEHPGPLNSTIAVAGSKPVPATVNVKDCPPTAGLGVVATDVSWGPPVVELPTVSVKAFDAIPVAPFWTATVKLPADWIMTEPVNCVALLVDSEAFTTVHGVHPVPLNRTSALVGSKPVPPIVNVKL